MNIFLTNLKDELEFKCITHKELAAKTGISINTIHSWFSKDIIPPLDSAYKISQAINQPLEYLINGDIFEPNNYHLPTREISLLENYRKLSNNQKNAIDKCVEILSKDYIQKDNDL